MSFYDLKTYENAYLFVFEGKRSHGTRDVLRQYSQWITPVFAMDYPVLAVDYSSTRNRLRRYSCVNRRKSPFKKEAYTAKSKVQ